MYAGLYYLLQCEGSIISTKLSDDVYQIFVFITPCLAFRLFVIPTCGGSLVIEIRTYVVFFFLARLSNAEQTVRNYILPAPLSQFVNITSNMAS